MAAANQVVIGTAATKPIDPTNVRMISTATTSELATTERGNPLKANKSRRGWEAPA
jgi:hypothetical protein